ncbi:protein phosphatase CheZ [Zooshikella harenae]|uniref:Protein phosphatase CheZ n=1 Tax=Zooshikella harenae TaxID=2827238 RepID=A0ABS5Z8R7_9GAMM|nr:protein phosphatase CheZ [Zooshikella harenae]MBU2710432.1 protein phosphatase CheZ [Zooshikella harenae]
MSLLDKQTDGLTPEEFEEDLKNRAHKMVEHLEKGNLKDAMQVIHEINEVRDKSLYKEIGRLTRALHEAIKNFHLDAGFSGRDKEQISSMADASERLSYVTKMTEQAANRTMDLVDESVPIAGDIAEKSKSLREGWQKLRKRQMKPTEFRELYHHIDEFLDTTEGKANTLYSNLNEIILAQDFQDLTGQVIKKVVDLVAEVEESLVHLVRMAGQLDTITGIEHRFDTKEKDKTVAEGPQMRAEERTDVVSGQDEVDDLLSSLGF